MSHDDQVCQTSRQEFVTSLHHDLNKLKLKLAQPGFGEGSVTMGAELEIYLVDQGFKPCYRNREILSQTSDPRWQEELNRYNIELNLLPKLLSGSPFSTLPTK